MSDCIIIKGLKIYAHHGVLAEEKSKGQYFYLNITLNVDLSLSCLSDNVEHTVNYDEVCSLAERIMTENTYDLIERAAQAVCDGILDKFTQVSEVEITLKKPDAPVHCDIEYAAVRICRGRGAETMRAVLGLGGNLGEPEKNLRLALEAINSLCKTRLLRVSNFYRTEAVEVEGPQPPYMNCAAEIETGLSPNALLGACLGIESALGRVRTGFKSPRTVDIDLLLYEGASMQTEELTLPHPRILYRAFVLMPLRDLYPDCRAPGLDFSKGFKNIAGQEIELMG